MRFIDRDRKAFQEALARELIINDQELSSSNRRAPNSHITIPEPTTQTTDPLRTNESITMDTTDNLIPSTPIYCPSNEERIIDLTDRLINPPQIISDYFRTRNLQQIIELQMLHRLQAMNNPSSPRFAPEFMETRVQRIRNIVNKTGNLQFEILHTIFLDTLFNQARLMDAANPLDSAAWNSSSATAPSSPPPP